MHSTVWVTNCYMAMTQTLSLGAERHDTYSNVGVTQLTNLWSRMSVHQLWEHPDNSHTNWGIQSCSTLLPWWYWTVTPLRKDLEIIDKSEGRYCTGIRYKWNSFEPMLHIDDMVLTLATGCCKGLGKSQYEAVNYCSAGMEYWNSLDCYKCLIQYRTEARTYLLIQLLC